MSSATVAAILFVAMAFVVNADNQENKLYTSINPGCDDKVHIFCKASDVNLVYSTMQDPNTTHHYFWSSFVATEEGNRTGAPAFIVAQTPKSSKPVAIDWEALVMSNSSSEQGAIVLDTSNAIGVIITRVFIFYDKDNTGAMSPLLNETEFVDWAELKLDDVRSSAPKNPTDALDKSSAVFKYSTSTEVPVTSFEVQLSVFASAVDGRNDVSPRLMYTPKSVHVEVLVKGNQSDVLFDKQRVGIEFGVVHTMAEFNTQRIQSMDDEYSPGVFSRIEANFDKNNQKSYMYWKPVGYTKEDRLIAHTVDGNLQKASTDNAIPSDNAVLHALFSNKTDQFETSFFNITFGSAKDSFYQESNYTVYSFVIGLDEPPQEKLSFLVEMIILVGFGLPAVFIVLSSVYLIYKRCRRAPTDTLLIDE